MPGVRPPMQGFQGQMPIPPRGGTGGMMPGMRPPMRGSGGAMMPPPAQLRRDEQSPFNGSGSKMQPPWMSDFASREMTRMEQRIARMDALISKWQAQLEATSDAGEQQDLQEWIGMFEQRKSMMELRLQQLREHVSAGSRSQQEASY